MRIPTPAGDDPSAARLRPVGRSRYWRRRRRLAAGSGLVAPARRVAGWTEPIGAARPGHQQRWEAGRRQACGMVPHHHAVKLLQRRSTSNPPGRHCNRCTRVRWSRVQITAVAQVCHCGATTVGAPVYKCRSVKRPSLREQLPAALAFSSQSATSLLHGPDRALYAAGDWTQAGLRLLGPALFGLAVISLRGRVKR